MTYVNKAIIDGDSITFRTAYIDKSRIESFYTEYIFDYILTNITFFSGEKWLIKEKTEELIEILRGC